MTSSVSPHPLWMDGAPGAVGAEAADIPDLTPFMAAQPNGAGVLVLPGGGYGHLATGHEGHDIAAWLNARGYHAWMLRYRLGPRYRHPSPLQDAVRAVELIRELGHGDALGVWGFSAGGHLAATLSTEPGVQKELRCAVLCYPVITLEHPHTHGGSRDNLLGSDPSTKAVEALGAQNRVSEHTPSTFLFHTGDDAAVDVENSLLYYAALRAHGVPAELHVYQHGPHGVGLAPEQPRLRTWTTVLEDWLGWAFATPGEATAG